MRSYLSHTYLGLPHIFTFLSTPFFSLYALFSSPSFFFCTPFLVCGDAQRDSKVPNRKKKRYNMESAKSEAGQRNEGDGMIVVSVSVSIQSCPVLSACCHGRDDAWFALLLTQRHRVKAERD